MSYMHKDSIIHFVGFITAIEPEDFVPQWESFARHFKTRSGGMSLQQEQEKPAPRHLRLRGLRHGHSGAGVSTRWPR